MKQNKRNASMQDAFEKVLELYENATTRRYICYNLLYLFDSGKITEGQLENCTKVIKSQLGPCASLEGWLIRNNYITCFQIWEEPGAYLKMKQTRINWLKHLIEQCKKNNL